MNLAIIGYGKMGQLVETVARRRGHNIALILAAAQNKGGQGLTPDSLSAVDVCIDFSVPDAVIDNVKACAAAGKNLVVGATGWHSRFDEVRAAVEAANIGCVYGANFSIGMNLFFQLVETASHLFSQFQTYDPFLHEAHHKRKLDAPSGTALALEKIMRADYNAVPVSSSRAGYIPGIHTVGFDSEADTITLTHTARNREGFAEGAILAAEWLASGKGLFEFRDLIKQNLGRQV